MHSYEEALARVLENTGPVGSETVSLTDAAGRVLAGPVFADRDLPPFHRSERDGWAVRAGDLPGSGAGLSWNGAVIYAGDDSSTPLAAGGCVKIMTGAPLPEGADAVVMVEKSRVDGSSVVLEEGRIRPGLHVHPMGVDAARGERLIDPGAPLTPAEIAVAASVGAAEVTVTRPVRVAIITTGDELVPVDQLPSRSQIRGCNGPALRSIIDSHRWLKLVSWWTVADDAAALEQAIGRALAAADAVFLSGGVSMGERDLVPGALAACGVRQVLHKVAIRPGKPFWLGVADGGKAVFGLPGNPVSLQVTFREFGLCGLRRMAGFADPRPYSLRLPVEESLDNRIALRQFIPARLVRDGERTSVAALTHHGSGDFVALSAADGVLFLPKGPRRIERDRIVEFHPWNCS